MIADLARRDLADRRRSLVLWTLGVLTYVGLIVAFYPTVRDQADRFNEMLATYPKAMLDLFTGGEPLDFGSPTGFLDTYLFAFMIPIMVLVLAIGYGAQGVAGDEGERRLELVLAYPLRRSALVLAKALVLVVEVTVIGVAVVILLLVAGPLVSLDLSVANLVGATGAMVLVAADFGLVALAVGAATGRKGAAAGAASALAAATYLVDTLAASWTWLDPVRFVSPWYWGTAGSPLANGLPATHLAVLLAIAVAAVAIGVVAFERRDVRG